MTPSNRSFVFDTNAIISTLLLKQSVSRHAFDKARSEGRLLVSFVVIEELHTVLKRKKFDKYVTESERLTFLESLVREAKLVSIATTITECRDPKDNKFLELAVSGNANAIISGDEDLRVLNPFRGILILNPKQFLEHQWTEES